MLQILPPQLDVCLCLDYEFAMPCQKNVFFLAKTIQITIISPFEFNEKTTSGGDIFYKYGGSLHRYCAMPSR